MKNDGVDAVDYLGLQGVVMIMPVYPHGNGGPEAEKERVRKKFDEWYKEQMKPENLARFENLPSCPCGLPTATKICTLIGSDGAAISNTIEVFVAPEGFEFVLKPPSEKHHPGGKYDLRQKDTKGGAGQQCIYDEKGKLITEPPGAGTPDIATPSGPKGANNHYFHDVLPFEWALLLDGDSDKPNPNGKYLKKYMDVRPPSKGENSTTKQACPKNPK